MTHEPERKRKSVWTKFLDAVTVASAIGIATLLIQVGGYKEKIDSLCVQFKEYSAKNEREHGVMQARIGKTQQAVVAATGKAIE